MPKVDMELVKLTLQRREELDARAIAQILEELDFEVRAGKRESAPLREKMRFLAIIRAGSTDRDGNSEGWIVQVPERADFDVPAAIRAAARDFNDSPKGRRLPVKSLAEAFEFAPARNFKARNVRVKTKWPVEFLAINGEIYEK